MRNFLIVLLCTIFLYSCEKKEELKNEPKLISGNKDYYDEALIVNFYNEVLDTLVGNNYVNSLPDFIGTFGVLEHSEVFIPDSTYFDWHAERFQGFTWTVEKAIPYEKLSKIFNKQTDNKVAWSNFRQQYGDRVFMEISIPFFSPDLNMVYVSVTTQSNSCSWSNRYIYKKENKKWVLKYHIGQ